MRPKKRGETVPERYTMHHEAATRDAEKKLKNKLRERAEHSTAFIWVYEQVIKITLLLFSHYRCKFFVSSFLVLAILLRLPSSFTTHWFCKPNFHFWFLFDMLLSDQQCRCPYAKIPKRITNRFMRNVLFDIDLVKNETNCCSCIACMCGVNLFVYAELLFWRF